MAHVTTLCKRARHKVGGLARRALGITWSFGNPVPLDLDHDGLDLGHDGLDECQQVGPHVGARQVSCGGADTDEGGDPEALLPDGDAPGFGAYPLSGP